MRQIKRLQEMSRPVGTKNIPLQKYGFVRVPEKDFTDDGARFTAYAYDPEGKGDQTFIMTKTIYDGEAYLSVGYTLPGTNRTKYIDDLNGVSIDEAIEGLPDLIKKIQEAQKEVASFTAQTLTDEEIEKFSDEVAEKATKDNGWETAKEVLNQHGFDADQLEASVAMKYRKAWEPKVKNKFTATLSKDKLRGIAADLLKKAIANYKYSDFNIEKAIDNASAYIRDKDGYIYISDLDPETVKRMKEWAKRKLTSADDFE